LLNTAYLFQKITPAHLNEFLFLFTDLGSKDWHYKRLSINENDETAAP